MGRIRGTSQPAPIDAWPVDPVVDRMLANWGRWCSSSGGSTGSSLWRFASRGTRSASYGALTSTSVDGVQARMVEGVVCNAAFSALFRALLKAHYVSNDRPQTTCAVLGIHRQAYEQRLQQATLYFAERCVQLAGGICNPMG